MEQQIKFIDLFLGGMSGAEWGFHILLMWMGISLYVLFRIQRRKDKSVKPSISVWIHNFDNIIALIISIILTYILIRFYSNYQDKLIQYLPEGLKMTPYFAMTVIGFGQHKISEWLGKKSKNL